MYQYPIHSSLTLILSQHVFLFCFLQGAKGLNTIIRRTANSNLYIFISSEHAIDTASLEPILKSIEDRIVFLSFDLRTFQQSPFGSLDLGRDSLELEIRSSSFWRHLSCNITASPSSLRLYTPLRFCPNLRVSALREAVLGAQTTFDDLLLLWRHAPRLVKCSVVVRESDVQPSKIEHARLEHLIISRDCGSFVDRFRLHDFSRLPRLRRLTFRSCLQHYIPRTALSLVHVSAQDCSVELCEALATSPLLKSFECMGLYQDLAQIKRLVKPTPAAFFFTVTRLTWHFHTYGAPRFIAPILRFVRRLAALPRLNTLALSTLGLSYPLNFRAKRLIRTILNVKKPGLLITLDNRPLAEYLLS